jgi:hypothetical protein
LVGQCKVSGSLIPSETVAVDEVARFPNESRSSTVVEKVCPASTLDGGSAKKWMLLAAAGSTVSVWVGAVPHDPVPLELQLAEGVAVTVNVPGTVACSA